MRSFIVLASLAYMATVAIASKAADAELFEAMQDRSAGMMDRSAELQDRQGMSCESDDACMGAYECRRVDNEIMKICVVYKEEDQSCDLRKGILCKEGLECSESVCRKKESDEEATDCPTGWIPLANTCEETTETLCVTIGAPLKYVSWFHLQYECDAIGGHLPEPTAANKVNLELVLSSIHSLYATDPDTPILMYLGATDVTHENEWKWLKTAGDLTDANVNAKWKDNTGPTKSDTKDCLAQQSSDKLWTNVDCEDDTLPNQIANVCFASPATAKELPVA